MQLDGCDPSFGDTDCPFGYVCFVHPESQVANLGACMLADEAETVSDVRGSAPYKRELLRVYVRRAVRQAQSLRLV